MNLQDKPVYAQIKIHGLAEVIDFHATSMQSALIQLATKLAKTKVQFRGPITLVMSPNPIGADVGSLEGMLTQAVGYIPEADDWTEELLANEDLRKFYACSALHNLDAMSGLDAVRLFGRVKDQYIDTGFWHNQLSTAQRNFMTRFGIE